ncbi:MAG: DegQ family serine endoprotease [Acetobacteraceae bacterium]|nr:DegQ family serine endoprotease [Acetobacteraceae bacterium]
MSHINRGQLRRTAFAAVLLAGTALGGYAVGHGAFAENPGANAAPVNPPGATELQHPLPDFSNLVAQVKPAVVSITTKMNVSAASDEGPVPFPFSQMFPGRARQVEARGSGFIINPDGTIVTNNHVVQNAKSVQVVLDDGTELPAKVMGRDPRTDIAVLKVDAGHKLPYIQLGDSNHLRPGEWVVAIGNPFGLGGTVTAGIVSAEGRDIGAGPYDQFIQIDAPINRGNSGGPLFTQDGKAVGMNTAILSPTGGSIGIGFAIPSNTIKSVVAQIEQTGHVTRGYIGVEAQQVSSQMAKALNVPDRGALLAGVKPDSPAAKAGLQPGDVIESVNGQNVQNPRDLAVQVAAVKPGDTAKLDVVRNGEHRTIEVTVSSLPNEQVAEGGAPQQDEEGQARVGLALAPLTPGVRDQFDVPPNVKGAVVAQVQPGSPAEQAGIQPGDVIIGIGTKSVSSPDDVVNAVRRATRSHDHALALRVIRNGEPAFVAINLDHGREG